MVITGISVLWYFSRFKGVWVFLGSGISGSVLCLEWSGIFPGLNSVLWYLSMLSGIYHFIQAQNGLVLLGEFIQSGTFPVTFGSFSGSSF